LRESSAVLGQPLTPPGPSPNDASRLGRGRGPAGAGGRAEAAFGAPVSIVFGQTEASPLITQTSPQDTADDRAHTLGRPLPQTEVKITDPASGQTVVPGVTGEVCARAAIT
jgi:acyl-CoA synthetase (AMP-forming)/AMP-acid ligase II